MGGGYPCRCCACLAGEDNFDRSDSSSLGSDWVKVAGDGAISSNMLTTSTSNSILRFDGASGLSADVYGVQVDIRFDTSGDQARIPISGNNIYVGAGTGSYAGNAAIEIEAGTPGKVRFVRFSGGGGKSVTRECEVTLNTGQWYTFRVCNHGPTIYTLYIDDTPYFSASYITLPVIQGAVGTGTISGNVDFDNFKVYEYYAESQAGPINSCPECNDCVWPVYRAPQLKVTISNMPVHSAETVHEVICADCQALEGAYYLDRISAGSCTDGFNGGRCNCYSLDVVTPNCGVDRIMASGDTSGWDGVSEIRVLALKGSTIVLNYRHHWYHDLAGYTDYGCGVVEMELDRYLGPSMCQQGPGDNTPTVTVEPVG